MLVLRGPDLPPLTAVFPIRGGLQGVFICARRCPDTGHTVWLVSDHNSAPFDAGLGLDQHTDPSPTRAWARRIMASLRETTPPLLDQLATLEACLYTGLTAERNFGAGMHMTDCYIDPLVFQNVLTIWPTKLTLTPFASNVAMRIVRSRLPEPSGLWPEVDREISGDPPPVAKETWRCEPFVTDTAVKTAWRPWEAFADEWLVERSVA